LKDENSNPIIEVLDAYRAAVYDKNVDAFVAIYGDDVRIFDMWGPQWEYQGIKPWRGMAAEWFDSLGTEKVLVDFDQVRVNRIEDLAFVSAFVKYTAISAEGKTLRSLVNRLTWVLERKDNVWKIMHAHTSGPADANTLKVSLQPE
jgi:uncharacterized protein (TIGR02246 family)